MKTANILLISLKCRLWFPTSLSSLRLIATFNVKHLSVTVNNSTFSYTSIVCALTKWEMFLMADWRVRNHKRNSIISSHSTDSWHFDNSTVLTFKVEIPTSFITHFTTKAKYLNTYTQNNAPDMKLIFYKYLPVTWRLKAVKPITYVTEIVVMRIIELFNLKIKYIQFNDNM